MNKVAILLLKELPIKCVSCKYQREVGIGNICILLDLDVDIDIMLDNRSINCPLISIDIDELEESTKTIEIVADRIGRKLEEKYDEELSLYGSNLLDLEQEVDTIKSIIDKLKGTYKNEI